MSEQSIVNGVTILRPMLPHDKHVIFEFAHSYGVLYTHIYIYIHINTYICTYIYIYTVNLL